MAQAEAKSQEQEVKDASPKLSSYDTYFERVQSRKKIPYTLQETLTFAFSKVPVSSFQGVPGGQVIEIQADTSIADAVKILSQHHILSAPVRNPEAATSSEWSEKYLGIVDYSAIILWVLETSASPSSCAATAAVGAGAMGAIGAVALGVTGPAAVAGLTAAAVCSAVAATAVSKIACDNAEGKESPTDAYKLDEIHGSAILQDEPFKSTPVRSVLKSFRWAPFLPVATDSSMLSVLLLLSKYRLRNVPVIEPGQPHIKNFITQSAILHGLDGCKGMQWFDCIAAQRISDLGLPFMSSNEVVSANIDDPILETFKKMRENQIGGLPVVEGTNKKFVGNVSISDIRYSIKPELFSNIRNLTVKDFMNTISKNQERDILPITCNLQSTLGNVIQSLVSKSVHRIYVVDEEESQVIGVITLRDVISCFVSEPPNHFDPYLGFAVEQIIKQ